jgi:hypothetical protein
LQVEDQASRAIYIRLRHRARVLRGLAIGFVALIALTLAFGAIPYFLAGDMAVTETRAALGMRRIEAERHAKGAEKRDRVAGEPAEDAAAPAEARAPARTAQAAPANGLAIGDEAFAAAVIRVTGVLLLVALTYLFGNLYRYSMRLASYYDEKADALRLLEAGDGEVEKRLSRITIPDGTPSRASVRRDHAG